jgi:hypothetical protein
VARTGSQEYLGRELKKNIGYDSRWGLQDNETYEVFRPLEEVVALATAASFEGKPVLDEHPSGDRILVDALDEIEGVSMGHVQNVRIGPSLPDGEFAGETPLLADMFVKHPELNLKIDELGIRQVSCGYTFVLAKDSAGRLIMTKIRGNHVAVVPRGRAGPEIAIGDAAPPNNIHNSKGAVDMASNYDSHGPIGTVNPDDIFLERPKIDFPNQMGETFGDPREAAVREPANTGRSTFRSDEGAADAHPMNFFNGRSYEEGRRLFNQHLAACGKAPMQEGRR